MSQIYGCLHPGPAAGLAAILEKMGDIQRRAGQPPPELLANEQAGVGLGCVGGRELGRLAKLDGELGAAGSWLLDGEIYGLSDDAAAAAGTPTDLASTIPALYQKFGVDFPAHMDGSFCVALWDGTRKQAVVANDRFSTRTLYWTHGADGFLFASELKALLATPFVPRRLDAAALSDSFAFNRILGEHTLLVGVQRLAPATLLLYDLAAGTLERRQYWRPENDLRRREPLNAERLEAIVEAFNRAVRLRAAPGRRLGVSLSGGQDSRAILSALARDGREAYTCTTGIAGCADQRLAAQISRIASSRHTFYELKREQIERYVEVLRDAVFQLDGMVLVGGFPAGLTQVFCDEHRIEMLQRGHGGENARLATAWPFQVNPAVLHFTTRDQLLLHLRRTFWSMPAEVDWRRLFTASGERPSDEAALGSLAGLLDGLDGELSPAEAMNLLYLGQNDGSMVPTTRNGLRGHAEMGLPYLDYRFLSLVLGTAVTQRCESEIHVAIVRRNCPALLKVANSNTGAPLDASPLRLLLTDKYNSLMRRLRLPGYRHYHYMEAWIRDFLAEQVRAIVLDERTLARGLFVPDYLRQLVERGQRDASFSRVLNLIVNLELWCRLFLDGEGTSAR